MPPDPPPAPLPATPRPDNSALNERWRLRDAAGSGWRRRLARGLAAAPGPRARRAGVASTRARCSSTTQSWLHRRPPRGDPPPLRRHPRRPRPPHGRDRRAPPHRAGGAGRARARPREAHRPGAGRGRSAAAWASSSRLRDLRARARSARGADRAAMKTVLVCAAQAPVHHGRRRDPGLRAARQPGAARVPGGRGQRPLQVVPGLRARASGPGLAAARRDGEQRHLRRPRDPHEVPELPGPPSPQGAWLFHQHREAYDLFGTPYCSFTDTPEDRQVREAIHTMDDRRARRVPTRSSPSRRTWPRGCARYNGLPGEPLYPPPHHLGRYRNDGYGDYLFYAGRLDRLKRLDLAIDAMQRVRSGARLKIAGTGPLSRRAAEADRTASGVADRVELLGFVSADDARRPLRRLPRRLLRPAQRGLRLRHGGGVPLRASRWSPPPMPAGRWSS